MRLSCHAQRTELTAVDGEMAQQLGVLIALIKDLGLVPSSYMATPNLL